MAQQLLAPVGMVTGLIVPKGENPSIRPLIVSTARGTEWLPCLGRVAPELVNQNDAEAAVRITIHSSTVVLGNILTHRMEGYRWTWEVHVGAKAQGR